VAAKAFKRWTQLRHDQPLPNRAMVLLNSDGTFETGDYRRLLFLRDNRPLFIIE